MTLSVVNRLHIEEQSTCFACGPDNLQGLKLAFAADAAGDQVARWIAASTWEGFIGVIHGGILATLVDEAMSKAVVTRGWEALTGELQVRYLASVTSGEALLIRG